MKKTAYVIIAVLWVLMLAGCQTTLNSQEKERSKENEADMEQRVIIVDSVEEPLPPEAEDVHYMPGKLEPQPLPNADLSKPIVITKMPVVNNHELPNTGGK